MTPPWAVVSDSINQIIERNLRAILLCQTSETILAASATEIADDADDYPWEFGEPIHHAPLPGAVENIIGTR
jgi:hypothetical protein